MAGQTFLLLPNGKKKVLIGDRFIDVEEVKKKIIEALEGITLQELQDFFKVKNTSQHMH